MSRIALVLLVLVGACKEHPAPAPAPGPAPATPETAPSGATPQKTGAITGHVRFKGVVTPAKKIDHPEDPWCLKVGVDEPEVTRIGKDDALLDSVVHLANGTVEGDPALAPKAVVKQKGCAYVPYAIGVLAGADVQFVNEDRTMHNIHGIRVIDPKTVDEIDVINFALASGEPPKIVQAPKEPGIVRLKCDVHRWMRGWLLVSDHPYFSGTNLDGVFTLSKVPVGKRTVEAFHPLHGTKRVEVEVKPDDTAVADFTFTDQDKAP
jgi:plastocyanin